MGFKVIKRRRMVRAFTGEPLASGVTERLLRGPYAVRWALSIPWCGGIMAG